MKFSVFVFFLCYFSVSAAQNSAVIDTLLVRAVKARENQDFGVSLELLTKARNLAQQNQSYRQEFLALNNIGAGYYSMLDYGEALDNYLEAYTIAIKRLDDSAEMIVLNNIGILYSKEKDFQKAEEYFKKAYELAREGSYENKIGLYALNLGILANQQEHLDLSLGYLDEARLALASQPSLNGLVEVAIAENQYARKEYLQAQNSALEVLPRIDAVTFNEERVSLYILLSNTAKNTGDLLNAAHYAEKALKEALNPENKISAYNQLSTVYKENGLMVEALRAKDSVIVLTDSLNLMKNGQLFQTSKVKFEIANYKRELDQNLKEQRLERQRFYSLIGLFTVIIVLIGWALRNTFIKNNQRKIILERSKEIVELELQKKKSDNLVLEKQLHAKEALSLLEQERLKNEIDKQNRKLAAKALQISSRNELLKEVINALSNQSEVTRNELLNRKVKELKGLLNNNCEWENFLTHFEEVNHSFIAELKRRHPKLNANDIRYLSYLLMDLSTKEIASLFNITPEASRKRKERITNKMELTDSAVLYSYISGL